MNKLGPRAAGYITRMFNISLQIGIIPSIWKKARVVPLLKPGKPADEAKSYRPVSLLSPLIKLFEKVLLPHLSSKYEYAEHQHGFTAGRSITSYHLTTITLRNGSEHTCTAGKPQLNSEERHRRIVKSAQVFHKEEFCPPFYSHCTT